MSNLLNQDDIKNLIADSLYDKDLINDELYEKCGKPHISSLPHDLRTNDPKKLQARKEAIIKEWNKIDREIGDKNYPDEFYKIAVEGDIGYNEDKDEYVSFDADAVIKHYDDLLNTHKDLNDYIRERYDNQIEKANNKIEFYKEANKEVKESINRNNQEANKLEDQVNNDRKELFKEQSNLYDLMTEYEKQENLKIRMDDAEAVIDNILKDNNATWEDLDAFDIDYSRVAEINAIAPGLYDYLDEYVGLQEEYDAGRTVETIHSDMNKTRDGIDKLQTVINKNQNIINSARSEADRLGMVLRSNNLTLKINQERVRELKKNKPKKTNKENSKEYKELVDKKNQAINFKNDIQ